MEYLFQDWKRNKGSFKGRIVMFLFRLGQLLSKNITIKIICFPIVVFIRVFLDWFLSIDIPFKTKIGKGCVIYHGHALVIFSDVIIGKNCTLRQGVTIGNKGVGEESKSPVIGDNCDVGASVIIIGDVIIGSNVIIGAGAVVVKSITSNNVVVGNPARIIKSI